ncbi:MAG: PQQ-dependent sugar dehydrogenase, partial [Longimicrobiales bacterium]
VNYGWRIMEGMHCFNATTCDQTGLTLPVHEYSHADGCSITGGYVYRGARLTGLAGNYFYSDFCTGFLRSFRLDGGVATDHREWNVAGLGNVLSFGEDAAGELYVLGRSGGTGRVHRLEPE